MDFAFPTILLSTNSNPSGNGIFDSHLNPLFNAAESALSVIDISKPVIK